MLREQLLLLRLSLALDGMTAQMGAAGIDIGEAEEAPIEEALVEEKDSKTSNVKKIETVSDAALFVEEPVDDSDMLLNTPQEVTADAEATDPEIRIQKNRISLMSLK